MSVLKEAFVTHLFTLPACPPGACLHPMVALLRIAETYKVDHTEARSF